MSTVLDQATGVEHSALVRAFPPVSIRDDAHLSEPLEVIDRLGEQAGRASAEDVSLGALTDLVETYEDAHVALPPTRGVAAARYLMEENESSQTDLVPNFGTPSVVSEVLAGKGRRSLTRIRRLAAHFGLPADVFCEAMP